MHRVGIVDSFEPDAERLQGRRLRRGNRDQRERRPEHGA